MDHCPVLRASVICLEMLDSPCTLQRRSGFENNTLNYRSLCTLDADLQLTAPITSDARASNEVAKVPAT